MVVVVPVALVVLPVPELEQEQEQELVVVAPQLLPELGPLLVVVPEPVAVVGAPR